MQMNSELYKDVPEDSLIAFIMLRDLQDSPEEFDERILKELQNKIETLPTSETINDGDLDLTSLLGTKKLKELALNGKCSLR